MHFQLTDSRIAFASSLAAAMIASAASSATLVGVLAHWTFDQTGGAIAIDSVSGQNGTLVGGAAMVAGGVSNGALQLASASGSMVDMGNILPLGGSQPCSICAWAKIPASTSTFNSVVSRHVTGTTNGYFFAINPSICYSAPGLAWGYRSNTCGGETSSTTQVNDGQWHFLVTTYHPNTGMRMYVDGGPLEAAGSGGSVNANIAHFLIGGVTVGATPTSYFDGLIDDVQIYDHALRCVDIDTMFLNPGMEIPPGGPDLNGDGEVDGADLGILLAGWGSPAADLNGDGQTDGADLGYLLGSWGSC